MGGNQSANPGPLPHLVVVGGSYGGLEVITSVKGAFRITLIDMTDFFENLSLYYKEYRQEG
jgi:NADH dehydrogenase FAD-containing subunit